ncbi:MAG TPA: hypothetical protein VFB67_12745 [Candidatus Polarisedimenticolaceae bacterium]|nr:hypothetical protein [Candidatus Polarisedimenticolaceae bacterium]
MNRRIAQAALIVTVLGSLAAGAAALASPSEKLPKCSDVKCRQIGCPADVLCVKGAVVTCADFCNGH